MERRLKILIVDDDSDFVDVLKLLLEMAGFETLTALEGLRAVKIIRSDSPDLVLLDWRMPSGVGPWVLQNLRSQMEVKKIPVVVLSGADVPQLEKEAKAYGAEAYVQKPFKAQSLISKIRTLLAESHTPR